MNTPSDDLALLRRAMQDASPTPDPERRAANLARAQAQFVQVHRATPVNAWSRMIAYLGAPMRGGLATAATAIAAVVFVATLPQPDGVQAPQTVPQALPPAPVADFADQSAAPPQAESAPMVSLRNATTATDTIASSGPALSALRDSLIMALPPLPPATYVLPWTDRQLMRDNGHLGVADRITIIDAPSDAASHAGPAPAPIRFIMGYLGLLEISTGRQPETRWSMQDALAASSAAVANPVDPLQAEVLQVMRNLVPTGSE